MYQIKVSGMSCGGCVNSVQSAIKAVDPQAKVSVDLKTQTVSVESGEDITRLKAALEDAGYPVQGK